MRSIRPAAILVAALCAGAPARAGTLTTLYSFTSDVKPVSGLTLRKNVLYGTTYQGGSANLGSVYAVSLPTKRHAQPSFATLLNFSGVDTSQDCTAGILNASTAAGTQPQGRPTFDTAGHMLVAAPGDGCGSGYGTLVQMTENGDDAWSATNILEFGPPHVSWPYGKNPVDYGGVAIAADNALIVTAETSTDPNCPGGPVLRVSEDLATVSEIYCFPLGTFDYAYGVTVAADGTIYGASLESSGNNDGGTIFSLSANGAYTLIYQFTGGADGVHTSGPVAVNGRGEIFAAVNGSTNTGPQASSVISLKQDKSGKWKATTIWKFGQQQNDIFGPAGPILLDRHGNLWGAGTNGAAGALYELTPPAKKGGSWTESLPYIFQGGADGEGPTGNLAIGDDSTVYGTTFGENGGPPPGFGTVFSFKP